MEAIVRREKAALRQRFKAYRAGLAEAAYAAQSAAIVARLQALPELQQAETVHTYWPLLARREIDLRPLIEGLHASGKQIVLPIVDSFSGAPRLRHVRYEGPDGLRTNTWGIDEPMGGMSVPVDTLDVVIVPALGAGRNGHRLGYGKGFYDAFLQDVGAPTLCPVFAACLLPHLPTEPHDVALGVLITENEVLRPGTA